MLGGPKKPMVHGNRNGGPGEDPDPPLRPKGWGLFEVGNDLFPEEPDGLLAALIGYTTGLDHED